MPRIYVNFSGLDQLGSRCKSVASKVDGIQLDLQRTMRQLDWDVRYESNINSTANQIARKLEQYSSALETYQRFIEDARNEYVKLDEYKKLNFIARPLDPYLFRPLGPGGQLDWKDILKAFGSAGSVFGIASSIFMAKGWLDWGNVGIDIAKTIASIAKDYNSYNRKTRLVILFGSLSFFCRNTFC